MESLLLSKTKQIVTRQKSGMLASLMLAKGTLTRDDIFPGYCSAIMNMSSYLFTYRHSDQCLQVFEELLSRVVD